MITFITAFILLIIGYLVYGLYVEKVFGADPNHSVPCDKYYDGVDYIPLPTWKVYLIQFLNIAGTGPIFGAIQGILFGPAAYFWIVLGCIFGGAVHDYLCGMISMRKRGTSLPEMVGDELGIAQRNVMRVFSLILLVLVGTVFTVTPAGLLANMIGGGGTDALLGQTMTWVVIILIYYILATLLPIDKLIGKIYPLFGLALLVMAACLCWGIFTCEGEVPEITGAFTNHHPTSSIPVFPGLFITIACGAVSGFHGTQSPLMARCLKNEKYGRPIFYGAMITEGIVALIWAAAAIKFADSIDISNIKLADDFNADVTTPYGRLWALMTNGGTSGANPAILVNTICKSWLGTLGAILAVLGVVAAPITSGDTAFRSARLIAADFMGYKQNKIYKRLILSIPLFVAAIILVFLDFSVLWRYFAWCNQTLAVFTLWTVTCWLARHQKNFWIALVPTMFMTLVCVSYILIAPEGFGFIPEIGYAVATIIALIQFFTFMKDKDELYTKGPDALKHYHRHNT